MEEDDDDGHHGKTAQKKNRPTVDSKNRTKPMWREGHHQIKTDEGKSPRKDEQKGSRNFGVEFRKMRIARDILAKRIFGHPISSSKSEKIKENLTKRKKGFIEIRFFQS